jgi:hypothetical protein
MDTHVKTFTWAELFMQRTISEFKLFEITGFSKTETEFYVNRLAPDSA